MSETEKSEWTGRLGEATRITGRPLSALGDAFESENGLVTYLTDANKASEIDGVGGRTARRLMDWFEDEYPEQYRERLQADEAVATEFTVTEGLVTEDGEEEFHFAFGCPRCGATNLLRGLPMKFANRPFRCESCGWVSRLDATFLGEFADAHYGGGDSE